ncbi:MAG: hypothetical protein CME62_03720 [Halobacteriovoraceae bacterium]|nr:hypothetical protein [Halobacteriovoraceae bacterium]
MNLRVLLSALLVLPALANAENVYDAQFQQIKSVELVEVLVDENGEEIEMAIHEKKAPQFKDQFNQSSVNQKGIGEYILITKELIALGKEIYKIIEAGKPVVQMNVEPIDILPRAAGGEAISAMQLHGWRAPKAKTYRMYVKNYMGVKTASMDVMLIFSYGGQNNGSGRFITGAMIKPVKVDVKWGYTLNANFKLDSIMNQGTVDNPVAGGLLTLDYSINTVLQSTNDSYTFFINGMGKVIKYSK